MDDLLNDGDAMPNIDELMRYINKDGIVLSVDDILWREKYILPTASDHAAITESPPPLPPVNAHILPTSQTTSSATDDYRNPLLEELTRGMNATTSPRDVVIHRDLLDDDSPREESAIPLPMVSQGVVENGVVVCDDHDVASSVDPSGVTVVDRRVASDGHGNASDSHGDASSDADPIIPSNHATPSNQPIPSVQTTQPHESTPINPSCQTTPRPSRASRVTVRSAKEQIVKSKTTIDDPPTVQSVFTEQLIRRETEEEAPFEFPYSSTNYVDVSQCMIDRINQGDFDKNPVNQNVNTFSL